MISIVNRMLSNSSLSQPTQISLRLKNTRLAPKKHNVGTEKNNVCHWYGWH